MKKILRRLLSQKVINKYYHLPVAVLANVVYGFPTQGLKVIGVTGTDGKTTTVNMIYQVLKAAGKKVSMVSTVNAVIAGKEIDIGFHVTSPNSFMVQKFAKLSKQNRDEYLILEVTSHALDQYRFWRIKFDLGVITNITHEHLDYHKTFENYFNTKINLLKDVKFVVINQNIRQKFQKSLVKLPEREIVSFGINQGDFNQKQLKLKLKIPGDYNIENALAALAVAFSLGIDRKIAQTVLEEFKGVKGRMEEIKNNKGINIVIDFAHTPNGLEQTLKALQANTKGKIFALIGCEGYRDVGKRSMMGEVARKLSDFVVVTSVDPRGQLNVINEQIIEGIKKVGGKEGINYAVIADRKKAIEFAISNAKKGDCIGIFGKGHERSMNLNGKKEIPWSDQEAVKNVLDGK